MIANYHTHSTFCDGKCTPEEMVQAAMAKGMSAIGFSSHGYTEFDLRYCMKDTAGYCREIRRLQEAYKGKIQVYLGIEEDAWQPANRADFDYIIGSCHYYCVDGTYYPIDSNYDYFKKCLELFSYDPVAMAHAYYEPFCRYIRTRKPDIVGHYDLITKFDEYADHLFLNNPAYDAVAERYMTEAAQSGCLFEINTGAIGRNLRTTLYPYENLLQILRKNGNGVVLASDSHTPETLDFGFTEARAYLKDQGFDCVYALWDGKFVKDYL